MKITLLRHAQVEEAYIGKYNGHIDIGLSQNGKLQAQEVAQELSHEKFDAVFCSDLLRAKQTLEAFKLDVTPTFTHKLREKSWGIHEGKSFEEIEDSGIKYENFEQWLHALDGQDFLSYQTSACKYFEETILKSHATNILLLSHAGFIRSLISHYNKIPLEDSFKIRLTYVTFLHFDVNKMSFSNI